MADDRTNASNKTDRARINVHEGYELSYWSKKLGVTRDMLREAVKKVGVMARDVQAYFSRRDPGRSAA